ncbi:MAG: alpha/beta hydrolase [Deltaproteobacteria bacterium]|nr:alpha/beta hydrolase [Deltaproteobacteria bacterium]MBT6491205.1 alpha/beta hydrolase [Deltaproteobacteria bacterium]
MASSSSSPMAIRCYQAGNKEAEDSIVFLNGLFHNHKAWIRQERYPDFKKQYRLIYLDYPGCGETPQSNNEISFLEIVDNIAKLIKQLTSKPVNLIGYSVGGMFAMALTSRHPGLVKRLVLLNTSATVAGHASKIVEGVARSIRSGDDLKSIFSLVYPWFYSAKYLPRIASMESLLLDQYASYNRNREGVLKLLQAIGSKPDLQEMAAEIDCPTLIVSGSDDTVFPVSHQEALQTQIRESQHLTLQDTGHCSYIENHRPLNQAIGKFFCQN